MLIEVKPGQAVIGEGMPVGRMALRMIQGRQRTRLLQNVIWEPQSGQKLRFASADD